MKTFHASGSTSLLSFNFLQEGSQLERKLGVEFKRENNIKRESFSLFRIIKIPRDVEGEIILHFEPYGDGNRIRVFGMRTNFKTFPWGNDNLYILSALLICDVDWKLFENDLRTLNWAQNRNYSNFLKNGNSKIIKETFRSYGKTFGETLENIKVVAKLLP